MEKSLFLLGLIRHSEQHGYQINELIGSHFDIIVNISRPTAYRLLHKMTDAGWITSREEKKGNRPPRYIYTITPLGEDAFRHMLRKSLADYNPSVRPNAVCIAFIKSLSSNELIPLLEERRRKATSLLQKITRSSQHQGDFVIVFDHQSRVIETELSWIDATLTAIKSPQWEEC
jgi:DNA-binding PadR family transcriptional regulator